MMVAETALVSWRQAIQGIEYEPYVRARWFGRTDVLLVIRQYGMYYLYHTWTCYLHVFFLFLTIISLGV